MMAIILTGISPSFADTGKTAEEVLGDSLVSSASVDWTDAPAINASSAILIDAGSGEILYEKDAYKQRAPASITKMLTALLAIENLDLDEEITVPDDFVVDPTGTRINLEAGEVMTVEELLYAAMLKSANDAADMLGIAVAGSLDNFYDMMNERAEECGALNSNFTSASGLVSSDDDSHVTTAYDIAMIAMEAMNNEVFRQFVSTYEHTIPATNKSEERELKSTNLCLYSSRTLEVNGETRSFKYDGATGVKTGYTEGAGYCLCGSAKDGDTELIAVVLNCESSEERFADVISLWDYGFSKYYTYVAAQASDDVKTFRVWQGKKGSVAVSMARDLDITFNEGTDTGEISTKIIKTQKFIKAPIEKGQVLAYMGAYNDDGELIAVSELVATESIEKGGMLSYIGIPDDSSIKFILGLIMILATLIVLRICYVRSMRKRRRRRRAKRNRELRRKEWERERHPFDN